MICRIVCAGLLLGIAACNRQDADTLGRIGQRLAQRGQTYLATGKNGQMIKSLPLLQRPDGTLDIPNPENEPGQPD